MSYRASFYSLLFCSLSIFLLTKPSVAAEVMLIGRTEIAATATDLSGQTDVQENGTPQNRLGGLGSGIAWTGKGNQYVMLPDRGPDDGATSYRCRFQVVNIAVNPESADPVSVQLVGTKLLTTADGKSFLGRSSFFDRDHPERGLRLDPEGIRATARGTILIADEYGPTVREFDSDGKWLRDLPTPDRYRILSPGATPVEELPPVNLSGRQNNRGWEGLALSSDGRKVFAIAQSPLIQDGGLDEKNVRVGTNIRLWEYDLVSRRSREFLYPLDDHTLGLSDLEMIGHDRFLVIERDGKAGEAAQIKRLYEIDLTGASDISNIERLPSKEIPDGIRPVKKRVFLDLLAPEYRLSGKSFPEKIEGIALGPKLPDGSSVLIVTSDNDFKPDEPTEIYAFTIK